RGAADFRKDSRLVTITVSWLLPVRRDPYISTVTRHPMAFHPNGGWSWADYPSARHPHVGCSSPSPITSRPEVSRSRRHGLSFNANRWRRSGHYNLSSRPRGRYFLCRCGRRHGGWFSRATDKSKDRQDCLIRAFFHFTSVSDLFSVFTSALLKAKHPVCLIANGRF